MPALSSSFARRFTSVLGPALVALGLAACAATSESRSDSAAADPSPDGGSGSNSSAGKDGGASSKRPDDDPSNGCAPSPTCARQLCECDDDTVMATDQVCLPGGGCDVVARCKLACGASGFSGGTWEQKRCSGVSQCAVTSQPTVECACSYGYGVNTYPRCTDGYCSSFEKDVCPAACQTQGGWTCSSAGDCTASICACKDGTTPVVPGACSGGSCSPDAAICPSACAARGGWTGAGSTGDAGAANGGPKAPGQPCSAGGECTPFDCTCNDGTTFSELRSCQSKVCATKSQTCSSACLSSGGWSGS